MKKINFLFYAAFAKAKHKQKKVVNFFYILRRGENKKKKEKEKEQLKEKDEGSVTTPNETSEGLFDLVTELKLTFRFRILLPKPTAPYNFFNKYFAFVCIGFNFSWCCCFDVVVVVFFFVFRF